MSSALLCARHLRTVLLPLVGLTSLVLAADKPPALPVESGEGQWVFSLLPKSFQKNPLVDQTVLTEMTEEGRKLPVPTAEHPVYYLAHPTGYHTEGHGAAGERPPAEAVVTDCLQRALAVNHYLPATPAHPPTLALFYVWGSHNNLDQGDELSGAFPDVGHRNLLSRAALVGGTKFAAELKDVLEKHDLQAEVGGPAILDPLRLYLERDYRTRELYEQSRGNCYYLVASAYDFQTLADGAGRKLLWRSKLTVDATGVAMADTLPTLVLSAGQYLGRDMPVAATFLRRIHRNTEVKLGPLEVKEYLGKTTPPEPEKKP
jgi:hypothetical protein